MKMKNVFSSHVDAVGYDPESKELHVTYSRSGKTAVYKDVPADKANIVLSSASVGEALHAHIRNQHEHSYLDD